MATITGLTAERMLEIEAATVVSGEIVDDHLILTRFDSTEIDTGVIPTGPAGPPGPMGGMIPGEIKMWPGIVLPDLTDFGNWVWADGAVYDETDYPLAAANIAPEWKTFAGASDPGVGNFRVPDMRGLVPAGLDQMPGGSRANRLTRAVSIIIAGKTGEETHVITVPEIPSHSHTAGTHTHPLYRGTGVGGGQAYSTPGSYANVGEFGATGPPSGGGSSGNTGGGGGHENLQPTVFVPYIVKLDD